MVGAFCEVYGETPDKRILEYMLENQDLDFAVSDAAREAGMSRPKAYEVIYDFEKKGYVKKSRVVGKTQLYVLNKKNDVVKLFMKDFKECLKLMLDEREYSGAPVGAVSARNC
ncbi:hypothetical protein GF345_06750 [Candidatus Woesearchaeota archaeon]|nr:hypothetical protein [Candidatus Woesearchaeota archaeon]